MLKQTEACSEAASLGTEQLMQMQPKALVVVRPAADKDTDATTSEELEGASPTSEHSSATVELYRGRHCARVHKPRRRMFSWVLRQLQRKQRSQYDEQYLPSGCSFDSLSDLDPSLCSTDISSVGNPLTQQQHHLQPQRAGQLQQPQQQRQTAVQQHCPAASSLTPSTFTSSYAVSTPAPAEGCVRRCIKAVLRPVVHLIHSLVRGAGPQGPGNNDNSMAERVINVLTSLPFFAVGLHGLRQRRCPRGRHFALSFLALGLVATGYHGADRSSWLRPVMRKLDYYTICYTSTVMRRAAHIPLPRFVNIASALVAPIKPTIVTGINLLLVEGKYLQTALAHAHLRPSFNIHVASATAGMVCFALEDVVTGMGWPPVLHSLWHCLSAAAMGCTHALLSHLELAVLVEGVQLGASGLA